MLFYDRVKTCEDAAKAAVVLDSMIIKFHRLKREARDIEDSNDDMRDRGYAKFIEQYKEELDMLIETWNLVH